MSLRSRIRPSGRADLEHSDISVTQLVRALTDWSSMRIEASSTPAAADLPRASQKTRTSFHTLLVEPGLSPSQARTLLGNAWTAVLGKLPEPCTSALLTAHWALETDAGRCMPGHNFAGIKATPGAPGKTYRTIEGHGATQQEVNARFRSYESAEAGARDYVRLLATRYPDAVAAARLGDSAGFAHALARGGYFTADPKTYAAGLAGRLASIEHGSSPCVPAPPSGLAPAALVGVLHAFRWPRAEDA